MNWLATGKCGMYGWTWSCTAALVSCLLAPCLPRGFSNYVLRGEGRGEQEFGRRLIFCRRCLIYAGLLFVVCGFIRHLDCENGFPNNTRRLRLSGQL
jgi:hypothetical protein